MGRFDIVEVGETGDFVLVSVSGDIFNSSFSRTFVASGTLSQMNPTVVHLNINYDRFPEETSWSLSANGGSVIDEQGTFSQSGLFPYNYTLPAGSYACETKDSFGDGTLFSRSSLRNGHIL